MKSARRNRILGAKISAHFTRAAIFAASIGLHSSVLAQVLNLPPRPANALSGSAFVNLISSMPLTERENTIFTNVMQGNVPDFLRQLVPVTVTFSTNGVTRTARYFVTADYVAIGSDADYFLTPMTPLLGQRLANSLNCSLPTRKMVNQIWTNSAVKLAPQPIPPSPAMTTVPVFEDHSAMVRTQRMALTNSLPLGKLVSGDKKDVVLSNRIYGNYANSKITNVVVIYGWHQPDGTPIQPLYNGHEETYADYSHGIRLVQNTVLVDGAIKTIPEILTNTTLAPLLSDEGILSKPRYTITNIAPVITAPLTNKGTSTGSNVTFNIAAIGPAPLNFQWMFKTTNIVDANSDFLTLTNLRPSQAGDYTVFVSNAGGVVSSSAALNVSAPEIGLGISQSNEAVFLDFFGAAGDQVLVQQSTNLADWKSFSIKSEHLLSQTDASRLRFYRSRSVSTHVLCDFETFPVGISALFQNPSFSASTSTFLNLAGQNFAEITNGFPAGNSSAKALHVVCDFQLETTNPWLRLTTFDSANLPNPTLNFSQALLFDFYTDRDVYVALGIRETGTTNAIGANGGTSGSIEWIGATASNPPRGKFVSAGNWTRLQFFIADELIRAFTGNGILQSGSGKGTLEQLAIAPAAGAGAYHFYLDNFQLVDLNL